MLDGITVAPIRNGEFADLRIEAAKDGHGVLFPSHVVRRYSEIVGYASICNMPVFTGWIHTKKATARDSSSALQKIDDYLRMKGHPSYAALCGKESPFFPVFEKRHNKLADFTLFERVF